MSWQESPLGAVADTQLGKMLDAKKNVGEYRLYLGNDNVQWDGIDLSEVKEMRFKDSELPKFALKTGDLLVCEGGDPGRCAIWNSEEEMYYQKALHRVRVHEDVLDNRYLYYFLVHIGSTQEIRQYYTGGATIKHLPAAALNRVKVRYPDLVTQQRIADVLSAYDELIENNRRQIRLLEEAAQRLYKEWFVDLKFPGHETTPIHDGLPEGWKNGKLGDIVEFRRGKTITKAETEPGDVPVVAGGLGPAYYHVVSNTTCPVITVSGSGANAGFTRLYTKQIWASDCSYADSSMSSHLLFAFVSIKTLANEFKQCQRGSAQPHVYPKHVNALDVLVPSDELLNEYEARVKPLFELEAKCEVRADVAREARDRLLPKLMSGEIEV
ncbi:restriction endonuclease subunit S [Paratractidigestivibacter sp.]|uniref:restriction endonuclease subunit S n=1 Tax=Paratractidigestivibacter sp. TaxID=2847316 RepID=UPI002AC9A5EB|nr:restriction endonuclease subunit S [Paratractidigestivibacter sp.]